METQKRKKRYLASKPKKQKRSSLEPGATGFLCTCNFRERDCVRDAYKILNEFADEPKEEDSSGSEDVSTALENEIRELRAEYDKPVAARRFQVVDTGVKNVIFIRTTLSDPLGLVGKILAELDRTKENRTRYISRFLPVQVVCKAYTADILSKADVFLEKYFSQEPKTFSIVFNRRSNDTVKRDEIIQELAAIINKKNPGNKAHLKNPEIAVLVEVIRGLCLLSIAPHYYKFKKYNLLEICNARENPAQGPKE